MKDPYERDGHNPETVAHYLVTSTWKEVSDQSLFVDVVIGHPVVGQEKEPFCLLGSLLQALGKVYSFLVLNS